MMEEFVLFENGAISTICVAPGAPLTAFSAARELSRCLQAMTGMVPETVQRWPQKGEISLAADDALAEEELCVKVEGNILWLDGGRRGILYAVTELLEQLGCRFFTEDCELLPRAERIALPGNTDIRQKPIFEYRNSHWKNITPTQAVRLRLNAISEAVIPETLGGCMQYAGFVHTLGSLSEMEGDFTDRQPCLTSEDTFNKVVKNLKARLKENPGASIASVSQNDSHDFGRGCQCEKCRKLDEEQGTPMGSLLPFVNRVADAIREDYPDLAIDTLAYRYTRKAPATLVANDNVIVRLCSIECCFSHPIAECDFTTAAVEDEPFSATLRRWADHCKRIYVWDYTTNFRNYNAPYPNFNVLRQNVRFFADCNVRGVFEQGNRQDINGEFGELRGYLLAKLLWDPYMSEETYQRHINEFLAGYYGKGADRLRAYFDRMLAAAKDVHFGIYYEDPVQLFVDTQAQGSHLEKAASFLAKGRADFEAAKVQADSVQRTRVERAEIQLDVYQWYLEYNRLLKKLGQPYAQDGTEPTFVIPEKLPPVPEDCTVDITAEKAALEAAAQLLEAHVRAAGIKQMHESFEKVKGIDLQAQPAYEQPAYWGA